MNILCIANEIGRSAAGIVYETYIKELSINHNVYILTPGCTSFLKYEDIDFVLPQSTPNLNWRLCELSATIFGCNIVDRIECRRLLRTINISNSPKIDFVLSFVSQQRYFGVMVGKALSKWLKTKWVVYSVDAIPAPSTWDKSFIKRKNVEYVFRKIVKGCDLFMSANPQMLQYQLEILHNCAGHSGVLYTPISNTQNINNVRCEPSPIFLYTGNIYGLRRVDILLDAFRMFLKEQPNAKILFVGQNSLDIFRNYSDLIETKSIEIYGHHEDLMPFYEKATVLLDLNADVDNDVFLSSKIINYLPIPKPILCISGYNSPARRLFMKDKSIVHCKYNKNCIYGALKKVQSMIVLQASREYYLKSLSANQLCQYLLSSVEAIKK